MGTPCLVTFGPAAEVRAELVEKPEEQAKGLSGRDSLPEDEGMLFWFGSRALHSFYMRNTKIPLDLLFLDFNRVVGILTMNPLDLTPVRIDRPSSCALEVNAGWAARHGVILGAPCAILLQ
jgi:uncharacterized protein